MWILVNPKATMDHIGYLPIIIMPDDEYPVAKQIAIRYTHGGGWRPMKGFSIVEKGTMAIKFPGDPPMMPLAFQRFPLSRETVYLYESAFILILNDDGSFEVTRLD